MTRKDYIRIAAALARSQPESSLGAPYRVWESTACAIADSLAQEPGTRFDRAKFLAAAGVA